MSGGEREGGDGRRYTRGREKEVVEEGTGVVPGIGALGGRKGAAEAVWVLRDARQKTSDGGDACVKVEKAILLCFLTFFLPFFNK